MGIPVSFVLIAVGAVLAFAVHQNDPNPPVDVDVVGWILMLVGIFGLLLSLLLWERWGPGQLGWHRGYATAPPPPRADYPRASYPPRRRAVVEEEEGPPPPGPPAP
jgi:Domain of unknown function (DUF6458)